MHVYIFQLLIVCDIDRYGLLLQRTRIAEKRTLRIFALGYKISYVCDKIGFQHGYIMCLFLIDSAYFLTILHILCSLNG